jgi:hypothetical protein
MALTQVQAGMMDSTAQYYSFKNRIINGAMVIDQRNAGAAVTINSTANTYVVDRWNGVGQASDGVFTLQQSSTAPAGFTKSLLATVTTADSSIGATQYYLIRQIIEGYNVADLGFGAAGASTFTLSFWVRSSVTGTFGGAATDNSALYCYPFSYTISAANTWEQKSITITGPTSGSTFDKTNGGGLNLYFSLGMGSTYLGTAGAWASATYFSATGSTNLISTLNATFYITGVQLEKGSTATSFDYRPFGTELALCQRYCWVFGYEDTAVFGSGFEDTAAGYTPSITPVPMRSAPTISANSAASTFTLNDAAGSRVGTALALSFATKNSITLKLSASGTTTNAGCVMRTNSASSYIVFSSEL